jgi:hypothetical protein
MRNFRLARLLRNKRALSAVVSNLIILVAAVLLSIVLVLYAMNVTTSQVQKEKIFIASSHIWYVNSTTSIAAIGISDIGPTDSVLTKIIVNGLQCDWNGTNNYVIYCEINGSLPGDLPFARQISNIGTTTITIAGQHYTFTVAREGLTVKSGDSTAFYIVVPNCIMVQDVSMPMDIILTTTQAVYSTETLVQSA